MPTTAVPTVLTDPGYLFWAPPGTAAPANTAVASKFSDAWPVAFKSLGATEDGSEFNYETRVEAITVAEFFDPIKWSTTERSGNFAFNLADYTLSNLARALNMNPSAITTTGATTTEVNKLTPAAPGAETRCMIGWESLDGTMRLLAYQTINGGTIKSAFKKAPSIAVIPCQFNFEVPASGVPFDIWGTVTRKGL